MSQVYTLEDLRAWAARPGTMPEVRPILSVIGDPVAHSLSPQMMNPALAAIGQEAQYIRLHLREEDFAKAMRLMPGLGFLGTNVTIPHKFQALKAVGHLDPLAKKLGAVNTIVFEEGGARGYNSDGPGFLQSLREEFGAEAKDLRVLILGAGGGAGRAVAIQCALAGARLLLVNRTRDKLEALLAELAEMGVAESRLASAAWDHAELAKRLHEVDLVVNGTSLGMKPDDEELLPAACLSSRHLVYDMVYRPAKTKLLLAAEAAGARGINGLSMLLHQGAISFEKWFGQKAPVEVMRRALLAAANA